MNFTNPFARDEANQGALEETCALFSLTKKQRFYGFGICFVAGFIFSILGTICLTFLAIIPFVFLYTLGNIISLMSTGFLVGPMRQLKSMCDPIRMVATLVFFGSMALTITFAVLGPAWAGLAIVFAIVQFFALIWYSASYVPYGRAALKKVTMGLCNVDG